MKPGVALGFKVRSGFAVAIALRGPASAPEVLSRAVVEMHDPAVPETKQPYHDGFFQTEENQREIARRVAIVKRCAAKSIKELLSAEWLDGSKCRGAVLVVGSVIEPENVGNPHIRAHAHEGRLFRVVLHDALRAAGISSEVVVEKQLAAQSAKSLGRSAREIARALDVFGKALGSPWRAEEKAAATAAWIALA
jgi:hypothetical protein